MSVRWIKMGDKKYNNLVIHEVKCPNCGHKETYHGDNVASSCFICGEILEAPLEDPS